MFEKCHCGSGLNYWDCCRPYIKGKKNAPTAEALMRSRYSAYVVGAIDYIIDTCHERTRPTMNYEGAKKWSEKAKWLGLKIIATSESKDTLVTDGDKTASSTVQFEAYYEQNFLNYIHHEIANFEKIDDRWFYVDGEVVPKTVTRIGRKVGRNDPCPCGRPKKYKHCCGR